MMQPNFEDLKRRIAALEKELPAPSKASRLEEIGKKAIRVSGTEHSDSEELCGYADGVLRRRDRARWESVRDHLKGCLECQSEVKQLRSAVPTSQRVRDVLKDAAKEVLDKAAQVLDKLKHWWWVISAFVKKKVIPIAAFASLIIAGFMIVQYKTESAGSKVQAMVYKEEVERLRAEIVKLKARLEARNEVLEKRLESLRANMPEERGIPPSSPAPYTGPSVPSPLPEVPYTPSLKP